MYQEQQRNDNVASLHCSRYYTKINGGKLEGVTQK